MTTKKRMKSLYKPGTPKSSHIWIGHTAEVGVGGSPGGDAGAYRSQQRQSAGEETCQAAVVTHFVSKGRAEQMDPAWGWTRRRAG